MNAEEFVSALEAFVKENPGASSLEALEHVRASEASHPRRPALHVVRDGEVS